jgi:hypothetical protein
MSSKRELLLALLAILAITGLYLGLSFAIGVPPAKSFFGHSIGVLGFMLMLATETLYSLRKRAIHRPWGRMRQWLQFHIFTGIVGPYLVFLHSAFAFQGLAGVVMLMTAAVVASGFVGRYIYTAVPRNADGLVVEAAELEAQLRAAEAELSGLDVSGAYATGVSGGAALVLGRGFQDMTDWLRGQARPRPADAAAREQAQQTALAQRRLRDLRRQLASLATARRLLATWHTVHIPLGMALFVAGFAHAAAAVYYATLLH